LKPEDMQTLFERLLDACHAEGLFKNCTKCMHWNFPKDICIKYNEKPPATIIVKGCDSFQLDEIPY